MHLIEGTLLRGGTYKIVRFISNGGFGCTYEAVHTLLDSRFAIKEFFPKDYCNREEGSEVSLLTQSKADIVSKLRKKFIEEAKAIFKMHHSNIVRVTDVFEENGTAYYVMDYIDGKSLADIVKKEGPLAEDRAVKYILQVADALKHVHSQNRLHLDIKPANIMIDKNDNAILIDFGASKHYNEETGEHTSTLMGLHTDGYAPIEQMNTSFTTISFSTDIYALGATLYKLLSGITPPNSISRSDEDELSALPMSISCHVRNAVNSAMQIKRKDRPQNIDEFIAIMSVTNQPTELGSNNAKGSDVTILDFQKGDNKTMINGHEYVDLGLSVQWANCNIGAEKPSDYGDYFAWGEISTKSSYKEKNSVTYKKKMGSIAGDPEYDVARASWGSPWRLPTREEIAELTNKCKWSWTTQGGHKGYKITGPNGNSIFLPAAGWRGGTSLNSAGERGYYWSATPLEVYTNDACSLYFHSGYFYRYWYYRIYGRPVRPVSE